MSTDWDKYSNPLQTRDRAKASPPEENGVIQLVAGDVRQIPQQEVIHAPLPDNRAHTNMKGPEKLQKSQKNEIRLRFRQI